MKNNQKEGLSMYKAEVKGKGGIVARVVAKSANKSNPESVICTFELEYPRFIHSELMTHRLFSRNAMSSRAVPVAKMINHVKDNPAMPIHWGANQAGMQAENECDNMVSSYLSGESLGRSDFWKMMANTSGCWAEMLSAAGYHKQIVNRILEPYQMMKTVLTATELDNFFYLRCHSDAQPEIKELANCMYKAYQEVESEILSEGEWHTPYVDKIFYEDGSIEYFLPEDHTCNSISKDDALKVSSSCCAQVSYRLLDNSIDKALDIYDKLVNSKPVHASPFEHQATPMPVFEECDVVTQNWPDGVTHMDSKYNYWSGNFKEWIQYRQLIKDNVCDKYNA